MIEPNIYIPIIRVPTITYASGILSKILGEVVTYVNNVKIILILGVCT